MSKKSSMIIAGQSAYNNNNRNELKNNLAGFDDLESL